jgi:aspartyl protease family protein
LARALNVSLISMLLLECGDGSGARMYKIVATAAFVALSTAAFGTRLADFFVGEVPREVEPLRVSAATSADTGARLVALQGDARGHFLTDVSANGQFIRVLVDTGASMVALTNEDARKIGLSVRDNRGFALVNTANGQVRVPLVRIPELRLQGLKVYDVEAAILPPAVGGHSLLGMSFLKRLSGFEMQGKTLVLRQ